MNLISVDFNLYLMIKPLVLGALRVLNIIFNISTLFDILITNLSA